MADKNIEIGIKTTGADAAAKQIDRVDDSMEKLSVEARELANAQKGVFTSGFDANRSLQAQAAMIQRQQESFESATKTTNKFTASTVSMRMGLQNVGYQLQDVAVQAQLGVSPLRIITQQLPQLLGGFGAVGAIAGAVIGIGAPLAAAFLGIGDAAKQSTEEVEGLSEAIAKVNRGEIDNLKGGIDAALEEQVKLRTKMDEVATAERTAAVATLTNDEKIRQAKTLINEALGIQIDKYKEIEQRDAAAAEKRKLESQNAIAAEEAKREKLAQDRRDAEAAVAAERQKQAELTAALQKAEQDLAAVYQKKASLESTIAKGGEFFGDPVENAEARIAQRNLDNPLFQANLKQLEDKVQQLQASIENFEGPQGSIRDANVRLQEVINTQTAKNQEIDINIGRIEEETAANDFAERAKSAADQQQQRAKDLSAAVAQIETTTAAGEAAKQTIQAAAADGKITADESQRVAQATSQIIAQIQAGLANAGANTQQILGVLRTVAEQEARNGRNIQLLQAQINQLFARIR